LSLALAITPIVATAQSQTKKETAVATDPFVRLNDAFRIEYSKAKTAALAKAGPLIIVEGNNVVLLRNGQRTESQLLPPIYHSLKAVAHIPFAVFLIFSQSVTDRITDERVTELQRYRELIEGARADTYERGFTDVQLQRQQKIINESLSFFDAALKNRQVTDNQLTEFTRRMSPLLLANVDEAAQAELNALHSAVTGWHNQMSASEWNAMHVVIISAHMPREGEVTMQYFMRLLHEPFEGHRIIFAEGLWEEPKAIDLLETHIVDGGAGAAFFGDYMRMHRDLLSDAAKTYIEKKLFP